MLWRCQKPRGVGGMATSILAALLFTDRAALLSML
jgi:hypothetical protein